MKGNNELMMLEKREHAVVSSRTIAEKFDKRHADVLRTIESKLLANAKLRSLNWFFASKYYDEQQKERKEFLLNRDAFCFVVMSFTGEKADEWKIKYIQAFNQMEHNIAERKTTEWLQTRKQGKIIRRLETDAIQTLIPYAQAQGSNHSEQMYTVYSKLVHSLVGIKTGERATAPFKVLSTIMFIEDMINHTIFKEVENGTYYKEIYRKCKENGEQIIKFSYLPTLNNNNLL